MFTPLTDEQDITARFLDAMTGRIFTLETKQLITGEWATYEDGELLSVERTKQDALALLQIKIDWLGLIKIDETLENAFTPLEAVR